MIRHADDSAVLSRPKQKPGELCVVSFHPESALFRPGCVNLRVFLCGVPEYASAQTLDFLARTKIFRLKPVRGMTKLSLLSELETASTSAGVSADGHYS
jgi:hypothetical protein